MHATLSFEHKLRKQGYDFIIGIDEAGRGPLAGPVVAAAVVLGNFKDSCRIDDSKKLSSANREVAYLAITKACPFGVGLVSETVIDRINILQATARAMEIAVSSLLSKYPQILGKKFHILIDGKVPVKIEADKSFIIDGDALSKSIAAASIVAKVTRDRIMEIYDKAFPQWGFRRHKGYGTLLHRQNLIKYGVSIIHRRSFLNGLAHA